MSLATSTSRLHSKNLNQDSSFPAGQGINPNLREGPGKSAINDLDLKMLSAIHGVLHQATDPTMVLPMVLASPAFHIGKVGTLRGLLGLSAETWWNRGLGARLISDTVGFVGETTFFSTASRGLTHLMMGPVPWDAASLAHDWVAAGMTLGFLKTAGFLGRRATLAWRGLDEAAPQLWSKADHRALWWASQASAYLGLVGAHRLEEVVGLREAAPGSHLWLDALGTHIALGLGAHGGRALLGARFANLEHQLSAQARTLGGPGRQKWHALEYGAMALAGPGLPAGGLHSKTTHIGSGALIQQMSGLEDGGVPKPGASPPGDIPSESSESPSPQPQSIRGVRRRMAETMDQSREVPRANVNVDVDIHLWPEGTNAMTRLMQAMIHGIQQVPKLNSWYRHGDKPTLEVRDAVDLGVAVDTPEGLVVVTLRDIAGLSGSEMRIRLKELQEKIKKGEIQSSELTGNTITLSNIGSIGGRYADPIVVPPTVAIVAAGRSGDQVVAYEGKPEVHRVMPLSLSFDHRPIDGAEATRFLEAMKTDLERPQSAVTPRPKGEKGNGSHGRPVPTESVVSKVERMEVEAVDRANRDLAATGEFRMEFPHIGEGVTKGELVTWLVKEGDRVRNDQDIAEVMTDKATVTIPSPVDGVVKSLKFQEGDMIEVGETFIILNTEESPSAQRKNKGNGSPSNGSGNGSGAGHQDFIEPSSRQASPVVAEAAPVEETLLESSVPFAALEPIPQTRAELVSSPRTPLPDVELTPLPGKIHTAPQTADRPKPQLEILQDGEGSRKLQAFSSAEEVIQFLTERSELNAQDKILYTQFVLDRLPPYSELLSSFCLPSGTARLDTALRYFVDYFSDESSHGFRSDLREHHLVSKGREADHPLGQDLLVLMRRSQDDAVYFLDRLGQLEGAQDLRFVGMDAAKDLHRIQPKLNYDLNRLSDVRQRYPELTEEALRFAYQHAVTQRILTEKIFRIKAQTGQPPFVVSDAGHEVHGTAAALALKHSVNRDAFAISPHYRSGTLVGMWSRLHGSGNFFAQYLRQQLSKITDPWSKGRETASHFRDQRYQILPGQSEVGRNLQKGAGYARALQQKGHKDGLVYAEMGDGSMALSDFHEVMVIANKMGFDGGKLPLVLAVVDNQMAISVEPSSGRALEDLQSYAKAHGIHFATCDGNDFLSVYETYREAVKLSREQQRPTLIWVQNLPRLNNHSSAAAFEFDFNQKDPLTDFGLGLVQQGILTESKILRRNDMLGSGGFFGNHQLGEIGEQSRKRMDALWERVAGEPDPTLEQTLEDVRLEFPKVAEAPRENRPTHTIINGAIRAALRDIIQENPMTWLNGQDTAMKGGVMQATAGLWELFPRNVTDAPINEPAIMSSALGFALHEGAVAFPEIQFGDYALSGYHWMLYAGNLLWRTGGMRKINWNLRLPVEPGIYGAVYHSTPLEGLLASIPGLTIVSFSTARDAYGLIRSAAEYAGPVVIFEPKALYRSALGDAFPGEPALNPKEAAEFEKWVSNYRGIPDIPKDFRVPLGKAAVRREGRDLTIVTWGLAHAETLKVMDTMVQRGIDVEVIDLRTLVPPDMETIKASVEKTGRLLVAHQDRVFASLGREIQGQVQEAFAGKYVPIRILGMQPVPGIPQSKPMEDAVRVKGSDILKAAEEMMGK